MSEKKTRMLRRDKFFSSVRKASVDRQHKLDERESLEGPRTTLDQMRRIVTGLSVTVWATNP